MWNAETSILLGAIRPAIDDENWASRWDVAWYVDRCVMAGFAKTNDEKLACARRYLAGKRKVSPPGHSRKKAAARELRRLIANPPAELVRAIDALAGTKAYAEYTSGNEKALNAMVGTVLKAVKADPAAVRELIRAKVLTTL